MSGEATPGEQQRLAAWSSLTGENSRYFEHIKTIFEKASAQQVRIHFDADAAWNKIRVKLRESESQKERFRYQINGPSILRIAAGIIFLLGAGFFTYQWLNPPIENFAVTSDRTTLQDTLPDGSTAFLNKRSSLAYEYNPREKTRRIKLKGEGFFEVKHHAEKAFVIEAQIGRAHV